MPYEYQIGTVDEYDCFQADTLGNDPALTTFSSEAEAVDEIQECIQRWPSLCSGEQLIGAAVQEHDVTGEERDRIVWRDTLRDLWYRLQTTVESVVDEDGVNVENAKVRRAGNDQYIYVDDVNGYSLMDQQQYEFLDLNVPVE